MPSLYLLYRPLLDFNEAWGVSFPFLLGSFSSQGRNTDIHTAAREDRGDLTWVWVFFSFFFKQREI